MTESRVYLKVKLSFSEPIQPHMLEVKPLLESNISQSFHINIKISTEFSQIYACQGKRDELCNIPSSDDILKKKKKVSANCSLD